MVERENSRNDVVRKTHGLRRGFKHHPNKLFNISNEEVVRRTSNPLFGEMGFNFSGSPPKKNKDV